MKNNPKRTHPRTDNGVVTTRFKVLKRDIRGTDTRRILLSPKMAPPLETSISSQEAGTLAVKKSATMILALTVT